MTKHATKSKKRPKWLIGLGVGISLYIISLFTPLIAPFSWYPIKTIQCGKRPVLASKFAASYTYEAPGDKGYGVNILNDPKLYFCSAEEAQRAGFRSSVQH